MLAFLHWVVGTGTSMIIGFVPEALMERYYVNTWVEPFAPTIAAIAFIVGMTLSGRFKGGQGASWVWVFGLFCLGLGVNDFQSGWDPVWSTQPSSWANAMANLFGPTSACSSTECLGELFITVPFTASVTYSLGAFVRRLMTRTGTISPQRLINGQTAN
jgi:hypothetical protein